MSCVLLWRHILLWCSFDNKKLGHQYIWAALWIILEPLWEVCYHLTFINNWTRPIGWLILITSSLRMQTCSMCMMNIDDLLFFEIQTILIKYAWNKIFKVRPWLRAGIINIHQVWNGVTNKINIIMWCGCKKT